MWEGVRSRLMLGVDESTKSYVGVGMIGTDENDVMVITRLSVIFPVSGKFLQTVCDSIR